MIELVKEMKNLAKVDDPKMMMNIRLAAGVISLIIII